MSERTPRLRLFRVIEPTRPMWEVWVERRRDGKPDIFTVPVLFVNVYTALNDEGEEEVFYRTVSVTEDGLEMTETDPDAHAYFVGISSEPNVTIWDDKWQRLAIRKLRSAEKGDAQEAEP